MIFPTEEITVGTFRLEKTCGGIFMKVGGCIVEEEIIGNPGSLLPDNMPFGISHPDSAWGGLMVWKQGKSLFSSPAGIEDVLFMMTCNDSSRIAGKQWTCGMVSRMDRYFLVYGKYWYLDGWDPLERKHAVNLNSTDYGVSPSVEFRLLGPWIPDADL